MKKIIKNKFNKIILSFALCLAMIFSFAVYPVASQISHASISATESEIDRPDSLQEGLSRKSLSELSGKRVTIRQPQMTVTSRNETRNTPNVMSHTYELRDFDTREQLGFSFTFTKYPERGNTQKFSALEKYLLLREVFYYNKWAMDDAANGSLMKHPAADGQYGAIEVKNNAVTKEIVTDPNYKSPMTSGLYLAPGEVVTVEVTGLPTGKSLSLFTHHQQTVAYNPVSGNIFTNYFKVYDEKILEESKKSEPNYESLNIPIQGQYERQLEEIPAMGATFTFTENKKYSIGCPFGGPLYIDLSASNVPNVPVKLKISGAIETPHYILGVTSPEDFEQTLRDAPGLIATLDVENGQLIGESKYMRQADDIEKIAYFWHSAFAVNASFNGRAYNYNITLSFDTHVPAGSAVALSATRAAHPSGWFGNCMSYSGLTSVGMWGVLHELGHVHANAYGSVWGMKEEKEGEVRNNTLIILIYTMLCNMDSRTANIEHGEFTHPYTTLYKSLNLGDINDYSDCDYFGMLSMYSSLIHYFGPETFVDFLYTYSEQKEYCTNPRADFVYRFARVSGMNISRWLDLSYKAKISKELFSDAQYNEISNLPDFYPIAYRWANGVNDTETSKKYEVDFANPTTFDFSGDNILCPVDFEIVSYRNPLHGTIKVSRSMDKVIYTPPTDNIYESDEFAVRVRIKRSGVDVYLPVRFNFGYQNSYTKVWDGITTKDIDTAINQVTGKQPTYTEVSSVPGKAQYTAPTGVQSYITSTFKFLATEAGDYSFYTRSDDSSRVKFYKDGVLVSTLSIVNDRSSYEETRSFTQSLNSGDTILIETEHINYGGKCYLTVGVKFPGNDKIVDIPKANMLSSSFDASNLEKIKDFGWKPKFFVSIKNEYQKNSVDQTKWTVLDAPKPHPNANNEPSNMVDGNDATIYHTSYNNNYDEFPHQFIFDTGSLQTFNYFEIVTRAGNSNSFIVSMALYGSTDNRGYQLLYRTSNLEYKNLHATVTFSETQIQYFKLMVYSTTHNGSIPFTVISEVYAGLTAKLEQTIKPSTLESSCEGFQESFNGELTAKSAGSSYKFEFTGTGFDLFANMGDDYGSAEVTIDGTHYANINLAGDFAINKLVYGIRGLRSRSHTVEIRTLSDSTFHIAYINVMYGVDTNEEPEPVPPQHQQKDEVYVNGHKFNEYVEPEPIPEDDYFEYGPVEEETSDSGNDKVIIIVTVVLGVVVFSVVGFAVYAFFIKQQKKRKKGKKTVKKSAKKINRK